jgi:hypothetical protein
MAKASPAVPSGTGRLVPIKRSCRSLSGGRVTMVQAPEPRARVNLAFHHRTCRGWPTGWRVFRESEVSPILMRVAHILSHEPLPMSLVQDNHVLQQIPSATPDPAFRDTVLPRTVGWLPMSLTAETTSAPNFESRSNQRNLCAGAYGSRICCTTQRALGFRVTLKCRILRRSWPMMKKQYRTPNLSVGTVKKSIAAIASR